MVLQGTGENARKTDKMYVPLDAAYLCNVYAAVLKTPTVGVEGIQETRVHTDTNYCIYYIVGGTRNITLYQFLFYVGVKSRHQSNNPFATSSVLVSTAHAHPACEHDNIQ